MFCMNCGQQLPDGAKFCLNCGTPQGAVSPTGTTQAKTINLDGMHTFVPALCPNCSAPIKVDSSLKIARCNSCGTECLVQDAIKALTVRGNVQVGSATINVSGTNTDSLLQRVEMMLRDGDFKGAMSKCETILDSDPTNGKVYFYMLMAHLRCRRREDLATQKTPFSGNQYYSKAMFYGDSKLKNELHRYTNRINTKLEAEQKRRVDKRLEVYQKNPKGGSEICFGTKAGKPIWWKVLIVREGMAFIISCDNICNMTYHHPGGNITWADCTLRKWLNNEFIQGCFAPAEQARILPCKLNNDNNSQYNIPGGDPTTDKVFLLSINEAKTIFSNYQYNKGRANGYDWWLRSPGFMPDRAAKVGSDGMVNKGGSNVSEISGVRPVLWIKFDS